MNFAKYGSRKFILALLSLAAMFALAWTGKLDLVASAGIIAAAGIYNRYNVMQKQQEAQDKLDAVVEGAAP